MVPKSSTKRDCIPYLEGRRIRYRRRDAYKLDLRDYWVPND